MKQASGITALIIAWIIVSASCASKPPYNLSSYALTEKTIMKRVCHVRIADPLIHERCLHFSSVDSKEIPFGITSLLLNPGKHFVSLYLQCQRISANPKIIDFNCEAGNSYWIRYGTTNCYRYVPISERKGIQYCDWVLFY